MADVFLTVIKPKNYYGSVLANKLKLIKKRRKNKAGEDRQEGNKEKGRWKETEIKVNE